MFCLLTSMPHGSVAVSIMLFRSVAMFSRSDSSSDRVFVPRMFLCGKIFTLWYTWINRYLVRLFEHWFYNWLCTWELWRRGGGWPWRSQPRCRRRSWGSWGWVVIRDADTVYYIKYWSRVLTWCCSRPPRPQPRWRCPWWGPPGAARRSWRSWGRVKGLHLNLTQ